MPIQFIDPPGLPQVELYHQAAVASGSRTVYIAGQVARDADGRPVGEGDIVAQVEQCYLNLATALEACGAGFDDVVQLRLYAVDLRPEVLPKFGEALARVAARVGSVPRAPLTGIGVAALAEPDLLVEVEAVAVLD